MTRTASRCCLLASLALVVAMGGLVDLALGAAKAGDQASRRAAEGARAFGEFSALMGKVWVQVPENGAAQAEADCASIKDWARFGSSGSELGFIMVHKFDDRFSEGWPYRIVELEMQQGGLRLGASTFSTLGSFQNSRTVLIDFFVSYTGQNAIEIAFVVRPEFIATLPDSRSSQGAWKVRNYVWCPTLN